MRGPLNLLAPELSTESFQGLTRRETTPRRRVSNQKWRPLYSQKCSSKPPLSAVCDKQRRKSANVQIATAVRTAFGGRASPRLPRWATVQCALRPIQTKARRCCWAPNPRSAGANSRLMVSELYRDYHPVFSKGALTLGTWSVFRARAWILLVAVARLATNSTFSEPNV